MHYEDIDLYEYIDVLIIHSTALLEEINGSDSHRLLGNGLVDRNHTIYCHPLTIISDHSYHSVAKKNGLKLKLHSRLLENVRLEQ